MTTTTVVFTVWVLVVVGLWAFGFLAACSPIVRAICLAAGYLLAAVGFLYLALEVLP